MIRRIKHSLISLGLVGVLALSGSTSFGGFRVYADPATDDPETIQVTLDTDVTSADPVDDQKENKETVVEAGDLEIVMAGAAVALNRYLESDFTYDSEELLSKIHIRPSGPEPTEEQPPELIQEETMAPPVEEPTDAVVETPPVIVEPPTEPPTEAPTVAPLAGYKGMAISRPPEAYVNVRTAPSASAKKVGKIYANAVADVLEEVPGDGGSWFLITSGSVTGYVKAEFFVIGEAAVAMKDVIATRIGTINTYNLRLRSTPDTSRRDNIITLLAFGTQAVIVGEEGEFYKIELDEGYFGYLHRDYVNIEYQYGHAISLDEERLAAEKAYQEQLEREAEEARRAEEARLAEEARKAEEARIAAEAASRAAAEAARLAEESRLAAEAASRAAAESLAEIAKTTIVQISARYTGGQKYVGDAVDITEVEIIVYYQDGHTEKNPVGWDCPLVGKPMVEGEITYPVQLGAFTTEFKVTAIQRPAETPPVETPPETQPNPPTQISEADQLRLAICAYAQQFVGNPYRLGGTDLLHGIDCSGFVMRVFQQFGISTTRTSRSQAAAGTPVPVDLNTLRPGDLLFYDTNGTITHVALYIGNGKIVHAANENFGICIWDAFYRTPCKAVTFLP